MHYVGAEANMTNRAHTHRLSGRSWLAVMGRSVEAAVAFSLLRVLAASVARIAMHVVLFVGLQTAAVTVRADEPSHDSAPQQVDPDASACRRKRRGAPVTCGTSGACWAADSAYWEACAPE